LLVLALRVILRKFLLCTTKGIQVLYLGLWFLAAVAVVAQRTLVTLIQNYLLLEVLVLLVVVLSMAVWLTWLACHYLGKETWVVRL
jgi:hypothetical protein